MFPSTNPDLLYHIYLMRHGQSEGNAAGVLQGQSDYPLSETGKRQARAVGRRWKDEGMCFDAIIASPLTRARHTAEIVAETLGSPLVQDDDWMERNNGRLAGLRPDEIAERYPNAGFVHLYQAVGETGESQWELYLRAGRAVQALIDRPAGRYLVVSHGGILNLAMYAILGIVPHANLNGPRFRFQNTGFALLEYNPERHTWLLERINDRQHWGRSD
ncbi:MAG: histidine phosphatase family protein [Chloroflexota bacterium]